MHLQPADLEKTISLRHTLHRCPELSMQEKKTSAILQQFLRDNTHLEICQRDGWFYAVKKAGPDQCQSRAGLAAQPEGNLQPARCQQAGCPSPAPGASAPIAFRADMDALPIPETIELPHGSQNEGVSHKCGHDGHCAALCGLALTLDQMETTRDVYLIFQPGEEIGAGALVCRDLITEKGISEIYAFHNLGGYPEGSLVYREGLTQPASEGLRICLTGKTSHASAPEKGNNPAGVLAKIVLAAQNLNVFPRSAPEAESQRHAVAAAALEPPQPADDHSQPTDYYSQSADHHPQSPNDYPQSADHLSQPADDHPQSMRLCTITGIRLGDGDFGISPGEGEVCMTLRAEAEEDMQDMEESILRFARDKAAEAGLEMQYSIHDRFPETRNHDACLARVLDAAERILLKKPAIPMRELWRASEDFGYYLKTCPGAMFYIGNGEDYPALHTTGYDFNDQILETAVNLFLELV